MICVIKNNLIHNYKFLQLVYSHKSCANHLSNIDLRTLTKSLFEVNRSIVEEMYALHVFIGTWPFFDVFYRCWEIRMALILSWL